MVGRHDDGQEVITHEFNYSVPNQVVYEANGVKITSTPVDHYDTPGPVAYRLEWNNLVFTYSGNAPSPSLGSCSSNMDQYLIVMAQNVPLGVKQRGPLSQGPWRTARA
jgi:hypothetical protein